jgi:hypothetical protein
MQLGKSKKLPDLHCLNCGKLIDGATSVDGDYSPALGDVTICIFCGHLMVFDICARNPTDDELGDLAGDKRILAIQKARGILQREENDD